ncbi:sugar ABC transporter permease [Paenibacillus sp. FSL R10-2771]|uniref:carbohydrate ABC transporter permease n=2 Tax=Paenibacillus TaxID=44249 RepID=UPI0004F767A2|nr:MULTISPECIES: sugar ABC transporter permease [unclassified Paenibacillus]AIQ28816.1 sugar ABC transporter permease [Paenibacillus sp. FSL P4-0081]KHL93313.1 sugar ABC transporter permease [Paenibacillus sp. IHB B 3415]OMF33625.1 sugar ABC transporter permease [Paenibacillus sp. FSL H8-0259]
MKTSVALPQSRENPVIRRNKRKWKEIWMGYLFTGPMLLGVIVFTLIPMIFSFILSFTKWSFVTGFDKIRWNGLDNFRQLFQDEVFLKSLGNNFIMLLAVPVGMAIALILGVIITNHVYAPGAFKVIYFMPQISSVVAVAVVWQVLFHPSYGPVNGFLSALGVDNPPKWLADPSYALPSVMLLMIWIDLGVSLIIYIAGIKNIPADLYEAATIDGASKFAQFRSITFPLLTPTTFFLLVTGIIGNFKSFALVKVLTEGGPANSTSVVVYDMYQTAFVDLQTGYASSMVMVLFVIVLAITGLQWLGQRYWVNY